MMNIRSGVLKSFDSGAYRAVVQMTGSDAAWLHDVPVARNIAPGEMVAGRRCAVIFLGDANPDDAVVVAVFT